MRWFYYLKSLLCIYIYTSLITIIKVGRKRNSQYTIAKDPKNGVSNFLIIQLSFLIIQLFFLIIQLFFLIIQLFFLIIQLFFGEKLQTIPILWTLLKTII